MAKIVTAPNPVLSQKAKPVKKVNNEIKKIIQDMITTLNSASDPIGVGLAAPQIGLSLQIFIAKPTLKSPIHVFINPKIINEKEDTTKPLIQTKKKNKNIEKLEGCLSVPNIWGDVKRKSNIKISYLDENGNKNTKKFTGFMATIIQHEMDHLQGLLFPKRVIEQKNTLFKSTKDEKGQDVFEEIDI